MAESDQLIEGKGGYDYLIRSISIVTLLYERGIMAELIDGGRITEEDVEIRSQLIRQRFPDFQFTPFEEGLAETIEYYWELL